MLLAGADGHEETRVALEGVAHRIREEQLQVQRLRHILIGCGIAAVAAGEWLHGAGGAALWAWTAGVAGAGAVAVAAYALWGERRRRPRLRHAGAGVGPAPRPSLRAGLGERAPGARRTPCVTGPPGGAAGHPGPVSGCGT